jgi:hypothetical protein
MNACKGATSLRNGGSHNHRPKGGLVQQQIYGIWQIVLKMRVLAINKNSRKLKMMRSKIPNAAYSNR